LEDNGVESLDMINEVSFEVRNIYLKIFLLFYADDTVLMSENVDGMQTMLNVFSEYCNTWKLQVNIANTKVVISS
jgi:ketosteroid isomerase-like protein